MITTHKMTADTFRCRNGLSGFFRKLKAGEEARIAFLGGSITHAPGWRVMVLERLQKEFPTATLLEIPAGIGGTGSDLGAFRLRNDVLRFNPDLLLIEFAVNDAYKNEEEVLGPIEGIIRQALKHNPNLDICLVYTYIPFFDPWLQDDCCPVSMSAMEKVAEHYHLPSINMALEIFKLKQHGKLLVEAPAEVSDCDHRIIFTGDGVHPLTAGHAIYADIIMTGLHLSFAMPRQDRRPLPEPIAGMVWEKAEILPLANELRSGQWTMVKDEKLAGLISPLPLRIYTATTPGASIKFRFQGRYLGLYEIIGPDSPYIRHTIDGIKEKVCHLQRDCHIYRHKLIGCIDENDDIDAEVRLELLPEKPDPARCLADISKLKTAIISDVPIWRLAGLAVIGTISPSITP